jgi:hypothetical protein
MTACGRFGISIGPSGLIMQYKGGFQSAVVAGDAYALKFMAVFEDNSTTTTVVAE